MFIGFHFNIYRLNLLISYRNCLITTSNTFRLCKANIKNPAGEGEVFGFNKMYEIHLLRTLVAKIKTVCELRCSLIRAFGCNNN